MIGVYGGVADQNVDPAPFLLDPINQGRELAHVRYVAGDGHGLAGGVEIFFVDLGGDRFAGVQLARGDDHLGTLAGVGFGDGLADSPA